MDARGGGGAEAAVELFAEPRLAEAGLADQLDDLPAPLLRLGPDLLQRAKLGATADERRRLADQAGLEAADRGVRILDLPGAHRLGKAAQVDGAEVAIGEEAARHLARRVADQHRAGRRRGLQPRSQIEDAADDLDRSLPRPADPSAQHHEAAGDADARLQRNLLLALELAHGGDDVQGRMDGVGGVVLVGARIAEIGEHAIAHELGEKAAAVADDVVADGLVALDQRHQILGVEPLRQGDGIDDVAEHHRQRPALGRLRRAVGGAGASGGANGRQAATAERAFRGRRWRAPSAMRADHGRDSGPAPITLRFAGRSMRHAHVSRYVGSGNWRCDLA